MDKATMNCRKCGKVFKMDSLDSSGICKKCRKKIPAKVMKTTKNFDF
ncbi:MAG: hypothetical protein ACFE9Z_08640 [Promethearchaeota archaeon]